MSEFNELFKGFEKRIRKDIELLKKELTNCPQSQKLQDTNLSDEEISSKKVLGQGEIKRGSVVDYLPRISSEDNNISPEFIEACHWKCKKCGCSHKTKESAEICGCFGLNKGENTK